MLQVLTIGRLRELGIGYRHAAGQAAEYLPADVAGHDLRQSGRDAADRETCDVGRIGLVATDVR